MDKKMINVAIDGTSSSGKSTMAKALAKSVGYTYIDTGAMYRSVALFCLRHGLITDGKVDVERLLPMLPDINISFKIEDGKQITYLNGENVENEIRGLEVSNNVSLVAAIAEVRHAMVRLQQEMGKNKGVVMDGRDIGTVVLPDAEIKLYVTTSPEIRAKRRFDEMRAKGDTSVTLDDIIANVKMRDHLDTTRKESPLRKADDAVEVDSGKFATAEEQIAWAVDYFHQFMQGK
ncbi:MAG: (d)CMP kinase [Bacteroidales bacterium]|jgi:cytidylate kinase|nr:(d)CMP kinase [Bacteroidales bacterium]MDY5070888.1 (d)CMP kinase [Sodaliphilus sp.]MDD7096248.1 (d)CMP kinase [Bacteroidales bacterium]MDY5225959.1 (d)CMP kinase [Sodaliphilus sp.]MDY5281185.1 (d)CMP kinase [Sodaliphilus sp.]